MLKIREKGDTAAYASLPVSESEYSHKVGKVIERRRRKAFLGPVSKLSSETPNLFKNLNRRNLVPVLL
jgi:hypothetical protein